MNYRLPALIFLTGALFTAPSATAYKVGPNIKTAIGPGFDLATSQPGPIQLPALPRVEVALDPATCGSNCGASFLDVGNAANPVLLLPAVRPTDNNFSILWGMANPGPISFIFNLPATPPDANGDYGWSAAGFDAAGKQIATFWGVFHLVTSSPINPASWVIQGPGPQQNSFEINFSTIAASDSALGFTLSENTTPLSFSALIGPNIKTAIGPGFDLVTVSPGPVQQPSLPRVQVALDPAACGASCGISFLDVGNAANPVLLLPAVRPTDNNFSILWGMASPGPQQFVFNLPATPPDANGDYAWSATEFDVTGDQIATFWGVFHLVTSSPINPASWVITNPGPIQNSFQINFSTMAAADAALGFTLEENSTSLSFSALIGPNI
jgi:hypothetical protein